MTTSVEELLRSFPQPSESFVLYGATWPVQDLAALLAPHGEIVLTDCTPDREHLTVAGSVEAPFGPVAVALRFTADAGIVVGLTARLPIQQGIADLAGIWGLDLSGVPEIFLAEVSEISVSYDLRVDTAVFLAETTHLRAVFGRVAGAAHLIPLIGLKDVHAELPELPFIGDLIPGGDRLGVRGVAAIVVGTAVPPAQAAALNTAVRDAVGDEQQWWPALPSAGLDQSGVWLAATAVLGAEERVWAVRMGAPNIAQLPDFPALPDLDLGAFRLKWSGFGLGPLRGGGWTGLGVHFDLSLDLGWLTLSLPGAGFDFDFSLDLGAPGFTLPALPALGLDLRGLLLEFAIPNPGWPELDLPGFPGLPGPGALTGWWDGSEGGGGDWKLWDFFGFLGIEVPALTSLFNPGLPSLGLRFDWRVGDFELIGETDWLRFVFGALPALPEWGTSWGKAGLFGITGLRAWLNDLPFIGDLLSGLPLLPDFVLDGISFSAIGLALEVPQFQRLADWISTLANLPELPGRGWWPSLSWDYSGGQKGKPGLSLGLNWRLPDLPSRNWGISWGSTDLPSISWPPKAGLPDISWLDLSDLDLSLGPLRFHRIGLTWPGPDEPDWTVPDPSWVLRLVFDVSFGWGSGFSFALPDLGFDFDLKTPSLKMVRPRLPKVSFTLLDEITIELSVPEPAPPWPSALTAFWHDGHGVSAADVARFLGLTALGDAIPEALMPTLYSLGLHIHFATAFLVLTGSTGVGQWQSGTWVFATQSANQPSRRKLVALNAAVELKASELPANTTAVRTEFDIVMSRLHLAFAEQFWTAGEVQDLNLVLADLNPPGPLPLPTILPGAMPRGFQVWGDLRVGDLLEVQLVYPDRDDQPAVLGGPVGSGTDLLGFAMGAIRFSHARLGLGFGTIYLALDATMAIGPVTVDLIGLGVGLDRDLDARPVLEGAALRFERKGPPHIAITGALVHLDLGPEFSFAMAGAGLIEIEKLFSLSVAGSWAQNRSGWTSLFAYAELNAAKNRVNGLFSIGPVTFTGIALGFGINSTVRTPGVADIGRFPLVKQVGKKPEGGADVPGLTPGEALNELAGPGGWVTPAQGQYWIAGGAHFTVYKFIRARVLVLVEWGQLGWKAMLAGSTTLLLPPTVPDDDSSEARAADPQTHAADPQALSVIGELGKVVVDFAFVYDSALGRFSMDAVIAKGSYILDPAAALTGGISLYVWGKTLPGISKGFVLSAGGYHPQFARTKPKYYPSPPRIGWLWERGPITFKGEAYAALTDGAFMLGAAVGAYYDSGHGINLRAWFTAHFDALVQWKPFYADIAFGLSVGVSASVKVAFIRIKISVEVGVQLQLWLPPVGGRAKVKLWFISFTIEFGADRKGAPPVPWGDFQIQLPTPSRNAVKSGLQLPDVTQDGTEARSGARRGTGEPGEPEPVLVRIDGFSVDAESELPLSKITIGGKLFAGSEEGRIDIRPMRLTGVVSEQAVTLKDRDGQSHDVTYWRKRGWTFEAIKDDVPQSMWGRPLAKPDQALNQPGLVPDCLTGLTIAVPAPAHSESSVGPVPSAHLDVMPLPDGLMPLADTALAGPPPDPDPASIRVIHETVVPTAGRRSAAHRVLAEFGTAPHSDGPLARYADLARRTMTDSPYLTPTGTR